MFKKGRRGNKKECQWGEFDQSTLYSFIEIAQGNPFVQLIHAERKGYL
jgi:hypothetical protein